MAQKSENQKVEFCDEDDFFVEQRSDAAIIKDIETYILRPIESWNIIDDGSPMIPDEEFEFSSENGLITATNLFIEKAKANILLSRSYVFDLSLLIDKQNSFVGDFYNDIIDYITSECEKWFNNKNPIYFKLIGEFGFHKLITTDFLHYCLKELLDNRSNNDIKCLIKLIKNCGYSSRLQLEYYMDSFKSILDENQLDSSVMEKYKKLYNNVERIFLSCEQLKLKFMQNLNKQNSTNYLTNISPSNKPETGDLETLRQFRQRTGSYSSRRRLLSDQQEDHTCAADYYIIKNVEVYNLNPIECYVCDDEFDNGVTDDQYEFKTKVTTEIVTKLFLERGKKNDLHSRSYAIELFYLINKQNSFPCENRTVMHDYVDQQCLIWSDNKVPSDYCFIGNLWFYRILSNERIRACIKSLIDSASERDIECLIQLIKGGGYSVALKINDHKEQLNKILMNNNYRNDIQLKLEKLISRFSY